MKNIIIAGAIALVGMSGCTSKNQLVVTNPLAIDRADETLVISRADMEAKFGATPDGLVPLLKLNGVAIPSQADDMDKNGQWDELAFCLNFKASETVILEVENVPAEQYPQFEKRTNLRLGIAQPDHSYLEVDQYFAPSCTDSFKIIAQGESVSWENDKMGFRNYFDCRNVKDLFGKLKPGFIIDKIHTPEIPDYHTLSDWGMDVLHCGSSTGSGGLALIENDSLYRLGSTDIFEYQKVVEGPVRSVFDLKYSGWHVAGQNLTAVERIAIYPGKYWFQSDVTVSGFTGQKQIVTGIVTSQLKNEPVDFDANSAYRSIATLDKQSLNNDELGMAVLMKKDEVTKVARATDIDFFSLGYKTVEEKKFSIVISQMYYAAQGIQADKPAQHYFFAVWGLENEKWKSMDNFKAYIASEAEMLSNPIRIE